MAFVSRSERQFSLDKGSTDEYIGPGTYLGTSSYKTYCGYAPFQSTSQRDIGDDSVVSNSFCTPSPVHYDPKLPTGPYESALTRKYVPFKTTSKRFSKALNDFERPGPGTYDVKGMSETQKSWQPDIQEKIHLKRAVSAPSIPVRLQSYGYEESKTGALVRQQGPQQTSGSHDCSVGPDHYYVENFAVKKRVVGGVIPISPRQALHHTTPTPGPGHYVEKKGTKAPRPGAAFVSRVSRLAGSPKKKIKSPGPGQYDVSLPLSDLRADHQFFGSTAERFMRRKEMDAPGPGAYQVVGQLTKKGATLPSKSDRFKDTSAFKENIPGPGQYDMIEGFGETENMNPAKSFSVLGHQGALAFGAMSTRFVRSAEGTREQTRPGPGAYESQDKLKMAKTQPSSFFKCKVPTRPLALPSESKAPIDVRPPPGAYNPTHVEETAKVTHVPRKNEGFLTGMNRFEVKKMSTIGPGQYNPQMKEHSTFNCAMGEPRGGLPIGFTTCSSRFDGDVEPEPGPGHYGKPPKWVKKTFNSLFMEGMR